MFKLSPNLDTLFILTTCQEKIALRNNCSGQYVTPPNIFYQIDKKQRCVELKQDNLKIKFLKKSMI